VCEQLAQGCYLAVERPGVEPATSRSLVRHATARLPSHTCQLAMTSYNHVDSVTRTRQERHCRAERNRGLEEWWLQAG